MATPLPIGSSEMVIETLTVNHMTVLLSYSGVGGGGSGAIGLPTDGVFGYENVAGILPTDSYADSIDKLNELVESLSTASAPSTLDTFSLSLADSTYSAYAAGTSTLRTNVQNNLNAKPITNIIGPFAGANSGTLEALVKNSVAPATVQGTITLTPADDTGFNSYLEITSDSDPYVGVPGQEGIYKALSARIGGTNPGTVALVPGDIAYSFQMQHTDTITTSTPVLTFYQDDSYTSAPALDVSNPTYGITSVGASTGYVSGVPVLGTADTYTVSFQVQNCVKKFYNATWTARVSGSNIVTQTALPTGVDRNEGSSPVFTFNGNPPSDAYDENVTVTCEGRNAAGVTASQLATATTTFRIDTKSLNPQDTPSGFINESDSGVVRRRPSGTGQYPAFSNVAYPISDSLASNEELQLLGGVYQYPPAVNYSLTLPTGGPDYSALAAGSHNNMRWATFTGPTLVNDAFVTVTINGQVNWGSDVIISGVELYFRVDGATGWLDMNSSFPGLGSPVNDGDPALDFSGSSTSVRRVTMGATARSGLAVCRIGIPQGSTKQFIGVSIEIV